MEGLADVRGDLRRKIKEADRLKELLDDEKVKLDRASAALEHARAREQEVARIEADAVTGKVEREVADEAVREIVSARSEAEERVGRQEGVVSELRRRTAEAGRAVCDAYLRLTAKPLAEAQAALREAENLLDRRRAEHEAALTAHKDASLTAEAALALYDEDKAGQLRERDREKERTFRWMLRQPRNVIEQLPLEWQDEARTLYDRHQDEAAAYRKRIEEQREEALLNPAHADGASIDFVRGTPVL